MNPMFKPKPLLPTPYPTNKANLTLGPSQKGVSNNTHWPNPTKFIPVAVRAKKMAKGLCSYCDQPFEKGHRCGSKTTQLFLVEIPGEGDKENGDTKNLLVSLILL